MADQPTTSAAHAIVQAFDDRYESCGPFDDWQEECLAAALRALADHQSPAWDGTGPACHWSPDGRTRRELRNLAAELEGQQSTSSTHQ